MAFGNIKHAVQGPSSSASASELMDDLKERNAALELQIKCAKDEIALRDSKIQALDRRTRRLEERIEQAEAETRCSDELVDELQDSKNLLADELKQVKLDLEDRASRLEKLEAQLEAFNQLEANNDKPRNEQVTELENCKAELLAKLQEAELQNSDLQNEVDYLMADIRDLEDQLQAAIPNAQEIIRDLEVSNEELMGKIQTLEANCLSLQSERGAMERLEAENNRLQNYVASMENKFQQLEQDRCTAQEMQITLRAEEQKNLLLQEELAAYTEKFAALERSHTATITSKEDRLRAVEVENDELRSSIQQIRDELQKRIDEVHCLEERCVSLSLTSKKADAKDELLQHLQASNQQLSAKLAENEAEYRLREEEIKNLQNRIMDLEDNKNCSRALEEQNTMLSDSLRSVESKHKELQTANAFLELKCMGLQMKVEDVHKLKQSIVDLQQHLDTAKREMEENSAKLTEKNDALIQELTLLKSKFDEKESEYKRLEKFSLTLQQQTAKDVLKSEEIIEELVSSNTKMSSIFAEKESEKLHLEREIESLREKISRMECSNDSQQGDLKKRSQDNEAIALRKELENAEMARVSQERQLKELEDQCMRLESFIRHQVGSPRIAVNNAETFLSGTGASLTTSECGEKWAKYNQSLSKLSSRNDKLQVDLEDTRQRISLISKDISRHFSRRGESTSSLSKYAQMVKKMSYRNDQIQMDLNEARAKVISLQEEQRKHDDFSTDSTSELLDRSQLLHQLATRHKDIHLELVKSRNKVIVLQKEIRELVKENSTSSHYSQYADRGREVLKDERRSKVSQVPKARPLSATSKLISDASTIISDSCDGSKFSI